MSERPPAPPGYKYNWLGQLREDPDYYPPEGFRLARNFFTNRLEILPLYGEGVNWLDPKDSVSRPKPAVPHPTLLGTIDNPRYIAPAPIRPEKIGPSVRSVEGLQEPSSKPAPGSDAYSVKKRDQGLFG